MDFWCNDVQRKLIIGFIHPKPAPYQSALGGYPKPTTSITSNNFNDFLSLNIVVCHFLETMSFTSFYFKILWFSLVLFSSLSRCFLESGSLRSDVLVNLSELVSLRLVRSSGCLCLSASFMHCVLPGPSRSLKFFRSLKSVKLRSLHPANPCRLGKPVRRSSDLKHLLEFCMFWCESCESHKI